MMVPVNILGVHVERLSGAPIVLLSEVDDGRVLPIFVGPAEAQAILVGLQGVQRPRPGTHDLLLDVLASMGVELSAVDVTELREGTFIAELVLTTADGVERVSSRPSDAIALAVRAEVPVQVNQAVFDDAGIEVTHEPDEPISDDRIDDIVDEFRSFLAEATPTDFVEALSESGEDEDEGVDDEGADDTAEDDEHPDDSEE